MIVVGVTLGNDLPNAFDLVYEVDHWGVAALLLEVDACADTRTPPPLGVGPPKPSGGGVRVRCPSRRRTL